MAGVAGLPPYGFLHGVRVIESHSAYEEIEDWSQVRSPGRARRRRVKYPQRIRLVYRPTMFQVGGTIYVHPEIYARLKADAHVQEFPCGVTDDCLLLIPKKDVPRALLYVAAAVARNEAWRFSYGRKATPERIGDFPVPISDAVVERINDYLLRAAAVEDQMIENAEDALDAGVARQRLRELKQGTVKVVRGKELAARLSEI